MQNVAAWVGGGGLFAYVRIFHKVRYWYGIYVTYRYHFFARCEQLVQILHSLKFAKCEICGSTVHQQKMRAHLGI